MLRKIISGGQTGTDRAGLDFAIYAALEHGGYVPKGRKAEDGRIDDRYDLVELPTTSYQLSTPPLQPIERLAGGSCSDTSAGSKT
jgi:Circularly permutated YpsA SLOG family